jgi:hypothetical protein
LHEAKPRTYRRTARQYYLQVAQKKNKSRKVIRRAIRQQLQFLRRNIVSINRLLDAYGCLPFDKYRLKYFYVIRTLYAQQLEMYRVKKHTVEDRIVNFNSMVAGNHLWQADHDSLP